MNKVNQGETYFPDENQQGTKTSAASKAKYE
jgi:hypothetical protein